MSKENVKTQKKEKEKSEGFKVRVDLEKEGQP